MWYIYIPDKPPSISIFLDELDDRTTHKADLVVARCLVGRHADVAGTNWRETKKRKFKTENKPYITGVLLLHCYHTYM